jgi:mannose-1-phosphate guanylyltransferase
MDIRAVVMAGGSGTRFWPLSRVSRPKQFLPIAGDKTMIEETVERILPLIPPKNILTIANKVQSRTIKKLLPGLPAKNILVEPQGKNTAPSLILATAWIYLQNPEAVLAVLPSDHVIKNAPAFRKKLRAATEAALEDEFLVTFGIPPTYPATGYGYIHFSREEPRQVAGDNFFEVQEFKEKPTLEVAKLFLAEGNHYWNSGMFIWRADVFARKIEEYALGFFPFWKKILRALKARDKDKIAAIFKEMPSLSIDYALMEKARGVLVCEGDFGWSDVGAWSSLLEIWAKDKAGNAFQGEHVGLNAEQCLVYSPSKLTALIGVKDIVVVETEDALLVCHRDQDQKVKEVIEILGKRGLKKYL